MRVKYDKEGIRRTVSAVLVTHSHGHPHLLLLQVNTRFQLPGGKIRPGESEVDGLRRKLTDKLAPSGLPTNWEIGDLLGIWWRPNFDFHLYPYVPPHITRPKECRKIYLVPLPERCVFAVPRNMKLVAVPLMELHGAAHPYGSLIASLPHLLSRFSFSAIAPRPAPQGPADRPEASTAEADAPTAIDTVQPDDAAFASDDEEALTRAADGDTADGASLDRADTESDDEAAGEADASGDDEILSRPGGGASPAAGQCDEGAEAPLQLGRDEHSPLPAQGETTPPMNTEGHPEHSDEDESSTRHAPLPHHAPDGGTLRAYDPEDDEALTHACAFPSGPADEEEEALSRPSGYGHAEDAEALSLPGGHGHVDDEEALSHPGHADDDDEEALSLPGGHRHADDEEVLSRPRGAVSRPSLRPGGLHAHLYDDDEALSRPDDLYGT